MQKTHTFRCDSFSSAYDFCNILDAQEDVVYTVSTRWIPENFGHGYIEYEIKYSYVIDGE